MSTHSADARAVREELIVKLTAFDRLPAMAGTVTRIVRISADAQDAVPALSALLLKDAALSQRLLRLANSSVYRRPNAEPVTTLSRAIMVLGFHVIKTNALAMLLADGMRGRKGQHVRTELGLALAASVAARELTRHAPFEDIEEAIVAALFRNIGRLLVAAWDDALYEEIARLAATDGLTPRQASTQVLGCSYETLAEGVLRAWSIPETIIYALAPIHARVLKPAQSRAEWMQQVATFSATLAAALPAIDDPGYDLESEALLERFGAALNLDAGRLAVLSATAISESDALRMHV
ncbi:HDOD domain-containing protein [Noviherbaspirillum pedocola]|uniref:HDOD domain-containing protein n=1 Tax=Noviherbaspirillum pedocola TaxID=2801341 RepID=A0A934WAJ0_9BURK|nr:HDOD domain-containing protein [Noviherbaspirillum pedocola]MBK4739119.1 HDOD domain-containing protein [Noviherbaspirillum pedocola]